MIMGRCGTLVGRGSGEDRAGKSGRALTGLGGLSILELVVGAGMERSGFSGSTPSDGVEPGTIKREKLYRTTYGWLPDATERQWSGNGWNGSVEARDSVPSSSRRLRSQCVIDVDGSPLDECTYGKPAGISAKLRCNMSSEVQRGQMLCNPA